MQKSIESLVAASIESKAKKPTLLKNERRAGVTNGIFYGFKLISLVVNRQDHLALSSLIKNKSNLAFSARLFVILTLSLLLAFDCKSQQLNICLQG